MSKPRKVILYVTMHCAFARYEDALLYVDELFPHTQLKQLMKLIHKEVRDIN